MPRFKQKHVILVVGIALILSLGVISNRFIKTKAEQAIREEIFHTVDVAVSAVNTSHIERMSATIDDLVNPPYQEIREIYLKLQYPLQEKNIRGIYGMKIIGDEIRFIFDSAPIEDPWHSEPGVTYEEPPAAIFEVALSGIEQFTGPYTDEYGTYYSVFAPIRNNTRQIVAVIGADIEASVYNGLVNERQRLPFAITLLTLSLFLIVYLYINRRADAERIEQERLHFAKEREAMLLNIGEGVVVCDSSGTVIFVSRFAADAIGVQVKDCLDKPYQIHWLMTNPKGEVLPDALQPFTSALNGGAALQTPLISHPHYLTNKKTGERRPVSAMISFVVLKGVHKNVIMTFRDITREVQIDRMKSEFISIASHQLKSPITALKWSLEMMRDSKKRKIPAPLRNDIDAMGKIIFEMNELVKSLLNISRLESGRIMVVPTPTDLGKLAADIIEEVGIEASRKKQKIKLKVQPRLPAINTDPRMIREVYKNFLTNAIKYTPSAGKIVVDITLQGNEVVSSVTDNGLGIPKAEQDRIFQKFYRGTNIISLHETGTGLGLFLAQQIVETAGGRIWFESKEGEGSSFSFALPLTGSKAKKGELSIS